MQEEGLSTFFDTDELGDTATFTGGSVAGQFQKEFAEVNGVEGFYPILTCPTADISSVVIGATMTIAGASYKVLSKRPDGTGISQVIFEAQ